MRFDDPKDLVELATTLKELVKSDVQGSRGGSRAEKIIAACALSWAAGELIGELEAETPGAEGFAARYVGGSFEDGKTSVLCGLDSTQAMGSAKA